MYDRLKNRGSIRKGIQSIEGSGAGFNEVKALINYVENLLDKSQSKTYLGYSNIVSVIEELQD